jgi:hypothetical protein
MIAYGLSLVTMRVMSEENSACFASKLEFEVGIGVEFTVDPFEGLRPCQVFVRSGNPNVPLPQVQA